MKYCSSCETNKDDEAFAWKDKKRRKRQFYCRECQKPYQKAWYKRNRKTHMVNVRKVTARLRKEVVEKLIAYFIEHPCVDCGEADILVLDFDHVGNKICTVSHMMKRGRSWGSILKEIAKCVVRCANCHRRKTAKEGNWWKYRLTRV